MSRPFALPGSADRRSLPMHRHRPFGPHPFRDIALLTAVANSIAVAVLAFGHAASLGG